jgi:hypothetical protein
MSLDQAVRYIRSMPMSDDLVDHVVSTAERLEDIDEPQQLEILDCEYTVTQRGTVQAVTITLTTGGPHIEADCMSGVVRGNWGSEVHTTHFDSDVVHSFGRMLANEMETRID